MTTASGSLGGRAHFLHWGVVQISLTNLIVIILMLVVFALAVLELDQDPQAEIVELVALYEAKGLSRTMAVTVAKELTQHDALAAHLDAELKIDADDLANPVQAAAASALSFTLGGLLPMLAILLPPPT